MSGERSLSLCVRAILSTTEDGACIFSGHDETNRNVRVVASARALPRVPCRGETWTIHGRMAKHPKYGGQLQATRCVWAFPQGKLLTRYLAENPAFAGLGAVKAAQLWNAFGLDLVRVLDVGDGAALRMVLSDELTARVLEAWAERRAEAKLMAYLDEHGFDARLANRISRCWGEDAIEVLSANPYLMLAFAQWRIVDAAAAKLGIARDDARRQVGAVEAALYERLMKAHTLTTHERLRDDVAGRLPTSNPEQAIAIALEEGAMVGNVVDGYQPLGAAALESGISERLGRMLAGETPTQLGLLHDQTLEVTEERLYDCVREIESKQGFVLNSDQRAAVLMAISRPLSLLTGGAGVGKTTVLRACLAIAQTLELPVFQLALAGRAAKRMTEATGFKASTIAKFLLDVKSEKLAVPARSLVIVDEASMLDLPTAYRLLAAMPEGSRLLLVGDPAQLPPIGFGLVLHRLAESTRIPQTRLTQIHRQAVATGIPDAANIVRSHRLPAFVAFDGKRPGVSFIEADVDEIIERLREVANSWPDEDWQLIAATKEGPAGINAINQAFHDCNSGDRVPGWRLAVGDPVIHLVNDYEAELMNGTLGRVTTVSASSLTIDFEGAIHTLHPHELAGRIELAYAISVHKAQGSQFRRVGIAVTPSQLLDHALIYTALTRGVEQVVFIGDRAKFETAVLRPPFAQQRDVTLAV